MRGLLDSRAFLVWLEYFASGIEGNHWCVVTSVRQNICRFMVKQAAHNLDALFDSIIFYIFVDIVLGVFIAFVNCFYDTIWPR